MRQSPRPAVAVTQPRALHEGLRRSRSTYSEPRQVRPMGIASPSPRCRSLARSSCALVCPHLRANTARHQCAPKGIS